MEFILSSQADSVIRMDRFEEGLNRLEKDLDRIKEGLDQVRANFIRNAEEHEQFRASSREQKEKLDILLSVSHDLVRVSRIHNERLKRLESKGTNRETSE
jgi:hypothetical protein